MSKSKLRATNAYPSKKLNDESLIQYGTSTPKSPRLKITKNATDKVKDEIRTISDGFLFSIFCSPS